MKNQLQVTPLLEYKIPKYPSFYGEDPLNPTKKKHSKTSYYVAALFGALGLFSFTDNKGVEKENPISFKDLGFPHTYASYGTGLPTRMDRENAETIIDSIFKVNGIELKKEIPFSEDGMKFKVTGYNSDSNIGYVWLDEETTAQDCYNSWGGSSYHRDQLLEDDLKKYEKLAKEGEESGDYLPFSKFLKNLSTKNYYKLIDLRRLYGGKQDLQAEITQYIEDNEDRTAKNYGQEFLDAYDNNMVDIKEMEKIVSSKDQNIAAFSKYSPSSAYYWEEGAKEAAFEKLENLVQDYIDWAKSEGRF